MSDTASENPRPTLGNPSMHTTLAQNPRSQIASPSHAPLKLIYRFHVERQHCHRTSSLKYKPTDSGQGYHMLQNRTRFDQT
eukprot:5685326-Amphidinium_carterae.2